MGQVHTHILPALLYNYIRYWAGTYIHPCSIVVQLYQILGRYVYTSLQHCSTITSDIGQVCTYILAALLYNYIRYGAGMYIHPCSIAVQLYQILGRCVYTSLQHCCTAISDIGQVCTYILAALLYNYIRYWAGMYIHPCSTAVQLYQIWGMYVHTSLQHCCATISDMGQVCTYIFAALLCNYIRYGAGTYIHPCSIAVQLYQIWGRYVHPCSIAVQLYQIWGRYVHTSLQHCCTTISDMGHVCTCILAVLLYNYIRHGVGMYIHPCSIAVQLYQT